MAFCTQRKFPGQCYEQNGLAEINKMKCYSSIKDPRAWSMDQSQQASYLVDAVHKGEGDTVNSQNKFSNGLLRCKNEIKKVSKRVGTSPGINTCTCARTQTNDNSLKMFEINMELETMKLNNKTLANENNDLRNRIHNIMAKVQDHDDDENNQILEQIILERNDLRELLDKFLGVTDQIIELKIQADHMKNIECDYKSLQTKLRAHQIDLESLRSENRTFENKIMELQTNNRETNTLKETNAKLQKDLFELSNMITVSDNLIKDQEDEIKSKLQIISQLTNQIESLKVALSEAEMKLNKKLRLEMDVELMEKELSIMIENSAESISPHRQKVIDRQVEDLATAIKLTLGYMNYELENEEDDNLVEANRQLKSLLLESSNKILEFKDVINKQEQNLMRVTNDFACKNDELTECLATVEDLKRQIANRRTSKENTKVDVPVTNAPKYCVNDAPNEELNEVLMNELNLADSQHNSDFESDGQEIEDLEKIIFEKSCAQQEKGDDDQLILGGEDSEKANKVGEMKSDLKKQLHSIEGNKLENKNLVDEIEKLKNSSYSDWKSTDIKAIENENEKLKKENENLVYEIGELKNAENQAHANILAMEKDLEKLSSVNAKLTAELDNKKLEEDQRKYNEKLDGIPRDCKELVLKNEELKNAHEDLLHKINFLEQGKNSSFVSDERKRSNELKKLSQSIKEMSDLRKTSSTTESILGEQILGQIISEFPKLKSTSVACSSSKKDVEDKGKAQESESYTNHTIQQMEKDLKKLASLNENLLVQLNDKEVEMNPFSTTPDIKNILKRNEELKTINENLSIEINELKNSENLARSDVVEMKRELDNLSAINKSMLVEINELKKLQMENEKLKAANENLLSEMEKLRGPDNRSQISILQMGKDLEKLAALNESLLALNDANVEKKQSSLEGMAPDVNKLLKQNQELKNTNENLSDKIRELQTTQNQAFSDAIETQNKLEMLTAANKHLAEQIKELEQRLSKDRVVNQNMTATDINNLKNENENLKATNDNLLAKIRVLDAKVPNIDNSKSDANVRTTPSCNELKKENENLKQKNENLVGQVSLLEEKLKKMENRSDKTYSKTSLSTNEYKKEITLMPRSDYSMKIQSTNEFKRDITLMPRSDCTMEIESTNENKRDITLMPRSDCTMEIESTDENKKDITLMPRSDYTMEIESTNENRKQITLLPRSDYTMEIDWMVADMKKLQIKNENLKSANEKLLSQISDLQSGSRSTFKDAEMKENVYESDHKLIYASNRNIEIDWMKADMEKLQNKNEKLKADNENLVAEIGVLKSAEARAHKNFQQMERDLLKLSAINERLSSQLNDKKLDKKQISKARVQDDETTLEMNELSKKIEELTSRNECLLTEISELKNLDAVRMKNDLKKLTSSNESLKLQISELKLLSANDLKMESDWMAADMRRFMSKNKKLNISNQNLANEINELRKELRSVENRANTAVLQKEKELEKLSSINESLTAQIEKKKSKNKESGLDAIAPDFKKIQKKNEELKAANEKLLAVIINLKNSEKLAISKVNDLEIELTQLEETNRNLQDTLENCVEKDWNKPKTELERLCQLILNEGISSLNDTEFNYMCKWFHKSDLIDFDVPKTSQAKSTRKHCRFCHQAVDPWNKTCDCKQYEEKKRLDLLREIEETKLAIKHIQSSNDIEFDLNDVRNRLLKSKTSDSADMETQYELKMCQSQESVNVRAHILNKPNYGGNHK